MHSPEVDTTGMDSATLIILMKILRADNYDVEMAANRLRSILCWRRDYARQVLRKEVRDWAVETLGWQETRIAEVQNKKLAFATYQLLKEGFEHMVNLKGGIFV